MSSYHPKGRPVLDPDRWWAYRLTHRVGPAEAARIIGVGRSALISVLRRQTTVGIS
jgi:hypothetical protein